MTDQEIFTLCSKSTTPELSNIASILFYRGLTDSLLYKNIIITLALLNNDL